MGCVSRPLTCCTSPDCGAPWAGVKAVPMLKVLLWHAKKEGQNPNLFLVGETIQLLNVCFFVAMQLFLILFYSQITSGVNVAHQPPPLPVFLVICILTAARFVTLLPASKNNFRNKFNESSCVHPALSRCACLENQLPAVRGDPLCRRCLMDSCCAALSPQPSCHEQPCEAQGSGDCSCEVPGKHNVKSLQGFIFAVLIS